MGRAGGDIHSEKYKNRKNSTHSKIKFYVICIKKRIQNIKKYA